jgi:3-hydroxymyristoyl/3-hydroxydecanoyl-(acyl carrier protein) dehydratase
VVESLADARDQTLTTHARLLSSTATAGTVIQKFSFAIRCAGKVIYAGESTFGYFSEATMAAQVGLDGGQLSQPWARLNPGIPAQTIDLRRWRGNVSPRLAGGRLGLLDRVSFLRGGGRTGQGCVVARRPVDPRDWFFPFHFHDDPVMPGSLGVEAVLDALKASALALGLADGLRSPRFLLPAGALPTTWRYRGQVTRQHRLMELEVHLGAPERTAEGVSLAGDASVWVDGLRIYEVKNAAVCIIEGCR